VEGLVILLAIAPSRYLLSSLPCGSGNHLCAAGSAKQSDLSVICATPCRRLSDASAMGQFHLTRNRKSRRM